MKNTIKIIQYYFVSFKDNYFSQESCPKSHNFITTNLQSMPIPGVKCPTCLAKGKTVWVIPGKNCPQCGTPCGRNIGKKSIASIILTCIESKKSIASIILTCVVTIGFIYIIFTQDDHDCSHLMILGLISPSNCKPHRFINTNLQSMPIPGVKCPTCLAGGKTVWVIPGKNCPQCGTPCGRNIGRNYIVSILTCVIVISFITILCFITFGLTML